VIITAAKIIDNKVEQLIEVELDDITVLDDFIKNELNLDGLWVSTKSHFDKYNSLPDIGSSYDAYSNTFIPPKPYPSWILTDKGEWVAPVTNNLRNPLFGYEQEKSSGSQFVWNEERQQWAHAWSEHLFKKDNDKQNGFYFIHKCREVKNLNYIDELLPYFTVGCRPACFDYHEVHPDWHEGYIDPIFRENSYASQYGSSSSNKWNGYMYSQFKVIYDGAPHFRILHASLADTSNGPSEDKTFNVAPELEEEHLKQHPQISARNLAELFRLIIDWDLAYHHFDNRENVAILCHDIMSTINMPDDIYNEVFNSIKDSPVSRYIKGDSDALVNYPERHLASPGMIKWFEDKYFELPNLKTHEILNINTYIDNHYYL